MYQVPDYLRCSITLDIFRDPVITPSGITYERAVILDHLQKVILMWFDFDVDLYSWVLVFVVYWYHTYRHQGKSFDPITRKPLYESQLIPNMAIKAAVQAFLDKHGWAYTMDWYFWELGTVLINYSSVSSRNQSYVRRTSFTDENSNFDALAVIGAIVISSLHIYVICPYVRSHRLHRIVQAISTAFGILYSLLNLTSRWFWRCREFTSSWYT